MSISKTIAAAAVAIIGFVAPASAGTLLPNGEAYFTDNNGQPLSGGCVSFFVPGTTTPKATYQDSGQTIANTNPVQLDAAGRAIIYGSGTYRQIVKATGPNSATPCSPAGAQIWDQLTASTDSSATIFAGASAGTPNAITVTAPAFSGADGQVINYISTNTNTGGATLNPSGFGNVQIVRDSATGPGGLTGGELVATNAVSVIYDATAGVFHILSPVTWPSTSGVPVGSVVPVAGFTAPTGYAFAYGQAVSRTTYSSLLGATTSQQTASLSSGSPTITGLSDTTQFGRGQAVEAVGIPAGATVQSCTSTACTLSSNATATRTGTVTFFAYGNGDGSTTFNIPDYRGVGLAGRDNMGGVAANVGQVTTTVSTTLTSTSATVASATGLAGGMTIAGNSNIPPGTTITNISGTTITLSAAATATQSNVSTRFSVFPDAQALGNSGGTLASQLAIINLPPYTPSGSITNGAITYPNTPVSSAAGGGNSITIGPNSGGIDFANYIRSQQATSTFAGAAQGGLQVPFGNLSPTKTVNYAVKLTP